MKIQTKIQKWGNGLALRVSGPLRDVPDFDVGTEVEVEISEEGFVVKRLHPSVRVIFPYSEAQLLESLNPDTAHADLLANPLIDEMSNE